MKRLILILLIFAISCNKQQTLDSPIMHHNYLSLEDAKEEVNSLLEDIDPIITRSEQPGRRIIRSSWTKKLIPGTRASDNPSADLYILNFENSQGFAIVSSDPAKTILGLALSGSLEDEDDIENPGLAITLANLEAYAKIPTRVDSIDHCEYGPWTNTTYYAPFSGYCPVKWNLGTPAGDQFNAYCPVINGVHCPAGGTAVAVAQLMSIYSYPSSYGGFSYSWSNMIQNSAAQDNQGVYYVAKLMQQLGYSQNLDMVYSPNASGTISQRIPQTMLNFGYALGVNYHDFTYSDIQEMKNHYPIIIDGEPATGNGHAWLGHGVLVQTRDVYWCNEAGEIMMNDYETRELILCNFGWGGVADGFYSPGAYYTTLGPEVNDPSLSTSSTGSRDFPYNIHCVSGIRVP
ncbi:MAG: C10 family peptidase [Bacteroidales bacterium]|nr:C10 family peptidase [Bacteroidales bacterium]